MHENELATIIVDASYKIHRTLGPGLLESIYELVLFQELTKRGIQCRRQVGFNVIYDGKIIGEGFRADIVVEEKVILEIKSVDKLVPVHAKQLSTYLKIADMRLGFLINFNMELIKDGIHRVANKLD